VPETSRTADSFNYYSAPQLGHNRRRRDEITIDNFIHHKAANKSKKIQQWKETKY